MRRHIPPYHSAGGGVELQGEHQPFASWFQSQQGSEPINPKKAQAQMIASLFWLVGLPG
eukprot:CAMPEP_0184315176 /NCGR_PEP_ID=MMETSP1049-20130417/80575_1 /TAXON_ID=77928 /ORGANISM="Proteomonas sulcata, Strain CCMP704" /LENGTH=58 /DNA_ID=CAMNT_0026633503 /DNA_START=129 /DNA_END=305 /DNA_ORIENTATION=-